MIAHPTVCIVAIQEKTSGGLHACEPMREAAPGTAVITIPTRVDGCLVRVLRDER